MSAAAVLERAPGELAPPPAPPALSAPPWFAFHARDFLADTAGFTNEQIGAFALLLAHQWTRGALPTDERTLAQLARMSRAKFRNSAALFNPHFGWIAGQYVHPGLAAERVRVQARRAAQGRGGRAGVESRRGAALANWTDSQVADAPPAALEAPAGESLFLPGFAPEDTNCFDDLLAYTHTQDRPDPFYEHTPGPVPAPARARADPPGAAVVERLDAASVTPEAVAETALVLRQVGLHVPTGDPALARIAALGLDAHELAAEARAARARPEVKSPYRWLAVRLVAIGPTLARAPRGRALPTGREAESRRPLGARAGPSAPAALIAAARACAERVRAGPDGASLAIGDVFARRLRL